MSDLAQQKCIPCEGGVPSLQGDEIARYQEQLASDWQVIDAHHLLKDYTFKNFVEAFDFMTAISSTAEKMNHHPDWANVYNKVEVRLSTHDSGGVTSLDVELASVMDSLFTEE